MRGACLVAFPFVPLVCTLVLAGKLVWLKHHSLLLSIMLRSLRDDVDFGIREKYFSYRYHIICAIVEGSCWFLLPSTTFSCIVCMLRLLRGRVDFFFRSVLFSTLSPRSRACDWGAGTFHEGRVLVWVNLSGLARALCTS